MTRRKPNLVSSYLTTDSANARKPMAAREGGETTNSTGYLSSTTVTWQLLTIHVARMLYAVCGRYTGSENMGVK